jgi:RND superfamily putative drug exporter
LNEIELSRWYRWSTTIQRHPVAAMLLSGGLLVILCIPVLSLRLGSSDAGSDPAGTTTRKAYDLLADGFGPGFNGPFQVVAELPKRGDDSVLVTLRREIEHQRDVAAVTPPMLNPSKDVGVLLVYPTTSPQSEATTKLLERLRNDVVPPSTSVGSPRSSRTSATC